MTMFKKKTAKSPEEYISKLEEPRKSEVQKIHNFILATVPELKPYIENDIIGYGKVHYKTKAGVEGEWFTVGLASQKHYISIYSCAIEDGQYLAEKYKDILGKASIGRSCIRYRKIEHVPFDAIKKILKESLKLGGKGEIG